MAVGCALWWVFAELLIPVIQATLGHPGPEEMHVINEHVLFHAQLPEGTGMAGMTLALLLAPTPIMAVQWL